MQLVRCCVFQAPAAFEVVAASAGLTLGQQLLVVWMGGNFQHQHLGALEFRPSAEGLGELRQIPLDAQEPPAAIFQRPRSLGARLRLAHPALAGLGLVQRRIRLPTHLLPAFG